MELQNIRDLQVKLTLGAAVLELIALAMVVLPMLIAGALMWRVATLQNQYNILSRKSQQHIKRPHEDLRVDRAE